jgi:hypothetical protein
VGANVDPDDVFGLLCPADGEAELIVEIIFHLAALASVYATIAIASLELNFVHQLLGSGNMLEGYQVAV